MQHEHRHPHAFGAARQEKAEEKDAEIDERPPAHHPQDMVHTVLRTAFSRASLWMDVVCGRHDADHCIPWEQMKVRLYRDNSSAVMSSMRR